MKVCVRGTKLIAIVGAVLLMTACGGTSEGTTSSQPSVPTTNQTVITITASGASPLHVTVPVGSQITFINNDTIAHFMYSDPHPEHTDCPDINQVGYLNPGESRQTGNMNIVQTCGFHDHNYPNVASLHGSITTK